MLVMMLELIVMMAIIIMMISLMIIIMMVVVDCWIWFGNSDYGDCSVDDIGGVADGGRGSDVYRDDG